MKKTLKALLLLFDIGKTVNESISDDGKVDFMESMEISMKTLGLVPVFKSLPAIRLELKASTTEQRLEALETFKAQLELENIDAEVKFEMGVTFLVNLANMIWPSEEAA